MSQTKVTGRQYASYVFAEAGIANIGAGNEILIPIMPDEYLQDLVMDIETAFNSGTTATVTVSDGTTTFMNAVTVAAAGKATVSNIGKSYPSGGTLTISFAQTGTAATAGDAWITALIITKNRVDYQVGT